MNEAALLILCKHFANLHTAYIIFIWDASLWKGLFMQLVLTFLVFISMN